MDALRPTRPEGEDRARHVRQFGALHPSCRIACCARRPRTHVLAHWLRARRAMPARAVTGPGVATPRPLAASDQRWGSQAGPRRRSGRHEAALLSLSVWFERAPSALSRPRPSLASVSPSPYAPPSTDPWPSAELHNLRSAFAWPAYHRRPPPGGSGADDETIEVKAPPQKTKPPPWQCQDRG